MNTNTVVGSRPYAWPFGGRVAAERTALVVVGSDTGWFGQCQSAPAVERTLKGLIRHVGRCGVLVVRVRHPASPGSPLSRWAGPSAHRDVEAGGLDGFFGSPLDTVLRAAGRDHLVMAGFGLEGPVHSTLRSANDRGYECLTLADASASINVTLANAALSTICMSGGIFGAVAESPELIRSIDRSLIKEAA